MKAIELFRLAARSFKFSRSALPLLGFAICAFCLCYSGAVWESVRLEKSQPCELAFTAAWNARITGKTLSDLGKVPGVTAVTPVLEIPATVATGKYSAALTLTGLDGSYIDGAFKMGGLFPASSGMPYIVLNEAACKRFSNGADDAAPPDIPWLGASFKVRVGSGKSVTSKVCGVMAGGEQERKAYISLSSAKGLLSRAGQSAEYTTVLARLENIGREKDVLKSAAALGLVSPGSGQELQRRWDDMAQQAAYLLTVGLFSLLCSAVLLRAQKRMALAERRDTYEMLLWLGMRKSGVAWIFALQSAAAAILGAGAGVLAAAALPSFLPQELAGASVFMLPVPAWAAGAGAGLCVAGSAFCLVFGYDSFANS